MQRKSATLRCLLQCAHESACLPYAQMPLANGLMRSALHSVRSADMYICCSRLVIRVIGNTRGSPCPTFMVTCSSVSCTRGFTMMPLDCKFGRDESGIRHFSNIVLASTMCCSTTSIAISAVPGGFSLGSTAPDFSLYSGTNLRFCAC